MYIITKRMNPAIHKLILKIFCTFHNQSDHTNNPMQNTLEGNNTGRQ